MTTLAYRKSMVNLDSFVVSVLESTDVSNIASAESASEEITRFVRGTSVPDDLVRSISEAYAELARTESDRADLPVAVRSSATAEDLSDSSVAGQHETFLWVKGADSVVEHVKECWSSAFAARSLAYRNARGMSQAGVEMAVVVQKMVKSAKSGVMFTLNPSNGDPSKVAIDGAWGLGEAVVSGVVTPDFFLVDKVTLEILTRKAGRKRVEFMIVDDRVEEREIPAERQEVLCLGDKEALDLAMTGKLLEKSFGAPLDIEWAIEDSCGVSNLYFLQARPETVWSGKARAKTDSKSALDMVVDTLKRGQKIS